MSSVLPFHGIAGAGTYEAGVLAGLVPLGVEMEVALRAAVNLHLFVLGSSILAAPWPLCSPLRGRIPGESLRITPSIFSRMTSSATHPKISVVIPFYNEGENVDRLMEELHRAMESSPWPWQAVLVDDGSEDDTLPRMEFGPEPVRRPRDRGGASAELRPNRGHPGRNRRGHREIWSSRWTGTGQNDPEDIVPLARRLVGEELDLVVGWRKSRRDGFILRRFPSLLANRLIGQGDRRPAPRLWMQPQGLSGLGSGEPCDSTERCTDSSRPGSPLPPHRNESRRRS